MLGGVVLCIATIVCSCVSKPGQIGSAPLAHTDITRDRIKAEVDYPFGTASVFIKAKNGWHRLDALDALAQTFLRQSDPEFPPQGVPLSLSVDIDTRSRRLATLCYGGKIGSSYWAVEFDVNGKIIGHLKGIVID